MDVTAIGIASMVGLVLLAGVVPRMRQSARRTTCEMNLKQLGLALHNYHSAYRMMPMGCGGTSSGSLEQPLLGNANRLSPLVGLTPFMEQQALWEKIANPLRVNGESFPAMGPAPWFDPDKYTPWRQRPEGMVCPADPTAKDFPTAASYTINYGDAVMNVGASPLEDMPPYDRTPGALRGMFGYQMVFRFRDVLDGLSNTLLMSEARIGGVRVAKNVSGLIERPAVCIEAHEDDSTKFWPEGRGACWADGSLLSMGVQTILPPNSPSATSKKGELEGVMSASSLHGEGAHVLMADGAVRFASNSIDAGDQESPTVAEGHLDGGKTLPPGSPSPFGVWGAMGTRASQEVFDRSVLSDPVHSFSKAELAEFAKFELETWHAAKGTGKIKARQVDLSDKGILVLLSEQGDIRRLGLSKFSSQDAYRAVTTHRQRMREKAKLMVEHLSKQLDLLEDKQFETFVREWVVLQDAEQPNDPATIQAIVKARRGELITRYDQMLEVLVTMNPVALSQMQDALARGNGPVRKFAMEFLDGRWKLILDVHVSQRGVPQPIQFMRAVMPANDPFGAR
ncbi:putative transmembrane region and signal peptide protein [Rhodopirellula islandica]|uniref:Transmembrane region and signal peptide protein n=1 Tax=Rhodopirellula islandica TaxID=595434 RepID=A0A0J1EAC3_RHOIS|nr:putative transmembrane region and signal peptide protein [Rhodopirellula islandica]